LSLSATVERSADGEPAFPFSWRQPLILVALYSFAFIFLASALHVQYGFPLDDSYIHQTVARNLAHYGIPGFVPGERSSGATSLIWTYLQAANYRFLHVDPVAYNLVFSWIMFALIGPLLFALARRDGLSARTCWILAGTPALCGNFLWLGLIGMEHLLFVAASLAAIYFWFEPSSGAPDGTDRGRWSSALCAGLAVGLLAITRPEAMVFGPLLLIASYLVSSETRRRSLLEMGAVLGIWAAFLAVILAANLYTSRALMPATLKGRTWLYFHTSGGPHSPESILRFLGAWVQRLPRMFSTHYVQQMSSVGQVHGSFAFFGFALAALALLGLSVLVAARPLLVGFLFLWAAMHFGIYLATFPTSGHGGRYQPLTLLLVFPCLFFGTLWLFNRMASVVSRRIHESQTRTRAIRTPALAATIVILIAGAASLHTWRVVTIDGVGHINSTHGRIGIWLKQNVPPDATIAAFDIGRISYDWGYGITDLGGLVDPTYYHYLVDGRVPDYLEAKHIQYLILPGVGTEGFGFQHSSLGMTKVAEYCSPRDPWLIGFRYTIHATQCQELYRLSYPSAPESAAKVNVADKSPGQPAVLRAVAK
jgi:hypothetical protein